MKDAILLHIHACYGCHSYEHQSKFMGAIFIILFVLLIISLSTSMYGQWRAGKLVDWRALFSGHDYPAIGFFNMLILIVTGLIVLVLAGAWLAQYL